MNSEKTTKMQTKLNVCFPGSAEQTCTFPFFYFRNQNFGPR